MHDINRYYGNDKPEWNPVVSLNSNTDMVAEMISHRIGWNNYPIYMADQVLSDTTCLELIKQFDNQPHYPVGVDGYVDPNSEVGSYRAMAWAPQLAYIISEKLRDIMHNSLVVFDNNAPTSWPNHLEMPFKSDPFDTGRRAYVQLGSTPWLRFMKYKDGGMHAPHHDAPYKNMVEKYITLFSWVLYLNTPDGEGGDFQFVNDTRNGFAHPSQWDMSDWTEMS